MIYWNFKFHSASGAFGSEVTNTPGKVKVEGSHLTRTSFFRRELWCFNKNVDTNCTKNPAPILNRQAPDTFRFYLLIIFFWFYVMMNCCE